ncbi:hypothetical protein [Phycicoccus sp. Soil748]|uniref:hypothetical protein n=1 Tax=Phycicoccus sp. Soil748 TaxID=1736397 RepID=UPI00070325A5|nr:hypothetical protein [Phycicoccus sp. Soil748]KRE57172.1 hypothetical protein ASG70_01720 [Phycicoccus sp. Soil748]
MPSAPYRARLRARAPGAAGPLLTRVALPLLLAALPVLAVRPVSDPSPWLHLKVGAFLAGGGRFALPDPWAPLASHAYVPTQWLPSVVTVWLYPHLGAPLVAWERAAAIGVLALALLLWAHTLARPWVAAATTAVAVFAAWPSLTERPQLAGFVLLVPVLAAWWRTAQDHQARWWLVPLTWLAACVHGIWATGAAVGGIVALCVIVSGSVGRQVALRLVGLLAACAAAAALTPIGPRLLLTPFAVSGQGRQFVQEWMPSSVRSPHVLAALALLAVAWLCWVALGRRMPGWHVVLVVVGCALALTMERTVAVAAFVAVPLTATAVEAALRSREGAPRDALPRRGRVLSRTTAAWAAATLVGMVVAGPVAAARADTPVGVPLGLTSRLTALPADTTVLVDGDTSGWLMYAAPQLRPVYDLRVESYSAHQVKDFIGAMSADPGWDAYVRERGVTVALVPSDSPVRAALVEQDRWRELGRDHGHVLLEAPR